MKIQDLFRASSVVMAGALVAFLPQFGDADPYEQHEQQQRLEKMCQAAEPSVSDAQCTVSTVPVPCGSKGHTVTSVSCSSTDTTIANDKCDGEEGTCYPPTFKGGQMASSSEAATPSLTVGQCVDDPAVCTCEGNGAMTYTWGRKTCN